MDLVSIIVPIYNVENYLVECLKSIINQSYRNLEIILIDDGSTDNSGKICDEYSEIDDRIKVIHKENGGLSSARNAGLNIANGEYFSFIDSDDCVAENFIETLYNLCLSNNANIAECDFIKFVDKADTLFNDIEKNINIYSNVEMQKRIYSKYSMRSVIVCNKLYKRCLFEGLRFPNGKIHEDEFITYKVFYNCDSNIVVTNEKLYYYRNNPDSITGKKFNVKRLDVLEALEERKKFYIKNCEDILYSLTVERYQKNLMLYYRLTKYNVPDSKKYLDIILKKSNDNVKEYMSSKYIKTIDKIKVCLFVCSPSLWCITVNFIDKIKNRRDKSNENNVSY